MLSEYAHSGNLHINRDADLPDASRSRRGIDFITSLARLPFEICTAQKVHWSQVHRATVVFRLLFNIQG
jgi:hypothetical protein